MSICEPPEPVNTFLGTEDFTGIIALRMMTQRGYPGECR
jgi:hypothetical protein